MYSLFKKIYRRQLEAELALKLNAYQDYLNRPTTTSWNNFIREFLGE